MPELQQGIYWDEDQTPPRHFAIVFLRVTAGANASDVAAALAGLTAVWNNLQAGVVPGLEGANIPPSGLSWLIGYGRKAFEVPGKGRNMPRGLQRQNVFSSVLPGGGGTVLDGAGIAYSDAIASNPATEEIAVQFLADTPLATSRAIVETWTWLEASRDPSTGRAPVMMSASFTGFNREDHRSWIGFHDGISNLRSGLERKSVIEVKRTGLDPQDRWTEGGTYLAFVRLAVDLSLWNSIPFAEQEALVGRQKISGCPIVDLDNAGRAIAMAGCPVTGTDSITEPRNSGFREPPDGVSAAVKLSHVQRANHHELPVFRRSSQRFFRQGYEFLEAPVPGRPLLAGLNFVSFQEHPERLLETLKREGWLGETNFGGAVGPDLITAHAAGIYFCPAAGSEDWPGQSIFEPAVA